MNQSSSQKMSKDVTPTFRKVRWLLVAYAVVGWVGFATVVVLSNTAAKHNADLVNATAWVHGLIVALTGIPFVSLADKAARNQGHARTRLQIVLTIVPCAFVAGIFILSLPKWMNVEQALCAILLAAAAAVYFTRKK
jgi:heme/copper-type cytochrome/quinol oxidase subunit 2